MELFSHIFQLNMNRQFEYMEWIMTLNRYLRLTVKTIVFNPFLIKTMPSDDLEYSIQVLCDMRVTNNDNDLPYYFKECQNNAL